MNRLTAWLAGMAALLGTLNWVLNIGWVGRIIASIIEALAPLLKAVVAGVVWLAKKLGHILYLGGRDILDSWATILTVAFLVGALLVNAERRGRHLEKEIYSCQESLREAKKPVRNTLPSPDWELPFRLW